MKILNIDPNPFHTMAYRSSGRGGIERNMVLPFYRVKVDYLPEETASIIAVSDLQGREKSRTTNRLVGEAVADELALLRKLEEIPELGMILLAGDFYDYPDCRKLGGTGDVTCVWNAFAKQAALVVGVHGNHDTVCEEKLAQNTMVLDGNTKEIKKIRIGGVSGIIGRERKNHRKTIERFKTAVLEALTARPHIFLLHQGPDDPENNQMGIPFIRDYLALQKDMLVLFGHCHWHIPFVEIGSNQILNLDSRVYLFVK